MAGDVRLSGFDARRPASHVLPPCYLYDVCAGEELPMLDCVKTIKSQMCPSKTLLRFNSFVYRCRLTFCGFYAIGLVAGVAYPFVPAPVGRALSLMALVVQLPGLTSAVLSLRVDMARVIFETYEFWFFTTMNLVQTVLLGVIVNDLRAVAVVAMAIGYELIIMGDANFRAVTLLLASSVLVVIVNCEIAFALAEGRFDQTQQFNLLENGGRILSAVDVLLNVIVTLSIFLLRNLYRRHHLFQQNTNKSTRVECVNYRCWVTLIPRTSVDDGPIYHTPVRPVVSTVVPLTFVPFRGAFDARDMINTRLADFEVISHTQCLGLYVCGFIGLACTVVTFALIDVDESPHIDSTDQIVFATVSISSTLVFISVFFSHYQRQLLWLVCTSFDFLFYSIQLTLALLCVMDMFSWSAHSVAAASTWLWVLWVLTLDALTPIAKEKLRLPTFWPILVMTFFLAGQAAITAELALLNRCHWTNRIILSIDIHQRSIEINVVSFFFSRLVSIMCLSLRWLWRLWFWKQGELIMIQGNVTFEDYRRKYRLTTHAYTKRTVKRKKNVVHPAHIDPPRR